jgi:hypothetical protein
LLSPLVTSGEHGISSPDGSLTTMTSFGQKQSDLNSLFECSLCPKCQGPTLNYMATIKESSRDGGKVEVRISPPTPSSTESTAFHSLADALSTLAMSQARTTQLTNHHEASTPQPPSSSLSSQSQMSSHCSLQISTQTYHTLNSTLTNAVLQPAHTPQSTGPSSMNPSSGMRNNFMKQKTSNRHGSRDNTLPPLWHTASTLPLAPLPFTNTAWDWNASTYGDQHRHNRHETRKDSQSTLQRLT